jgi:hypothetical protein
MMHLFNSRKPRPIEAEPIPPGLTRCDNKECSSLCEPPFCTVGVDEMTGGRCVVAVLCCDCWDRFDREDEDVFLL